MTSIKYLIKELVQLLFYPLQMIYEFINGDRDVLYKPKKD
jgi:hypothetical protein